jgi:hypothetical protein
MKNVNFLLVLCLAVIMLGGVCGVCYNPSTKLWGIEVRPAFDVGDCFIAPGLDPWMPNAVVRKVLKVGNVSYKVIEKCSEKDCIWFFKSYILFKDQHNYVKSICED